MVQISKNLIEKAVLQNFPRKQLLLDYRCTRISNEIPSPAEILFGRKFHCSLLILPSHIFNDRINIQRELIVKEEGNFHPCSTNRITATSSSQGRAKRMGILLILSHIQTFQKKSQIDLLPVQSMPFPQYPQQSRTAILHPRPPKPQDITTI